MYHVQTKKHYIYVALYSKGMRAHGILFSCFKILLHEKYADKDINQPLNQYRPHM